MGGLDLKSPQFRAIIDDFNADPDSYDYDGWTLKEWPFYFLANLMESQTGQDSQAFAEIMKLHGKEKLYHYAGMDFTNVGRFRVDTQKPNAVFILPVADYNGAFSDPERIQLYDDLKNSYDVMLTTAENVDQLCKALLSVPNISLVVISGHGSPKSLQLAEDQGQSGYLRMNDKKFAFCFQNLRPDAVIFLNSCSTATNRGEGKENLAESIASLSGGKEVVGSNKAVSGIKLLSAIPFEVSTMATDENGRTVDATVVYPRSVGRR